MTTTRRIRISAAVLLIGTLSACSTLQPTQGTTSHDLGGLYPVGGTRSPVPLKSVSVTTTPLVSAAAMQYREASQPTRRAAYAQNRWAAPPAAMVEPALLRLLDANGSGNCRLNVSLAEFIIEVDASGSSRARIAADLRLIADGRPAPVLHSLDVSAPLVRTAPAEGAQAMRVAVQTLGERIAAWLGGAAGQSCKA